MVTVNRIGHTLVEIHLKTRDITEEMKGAEATESSSLTEFKKRAMSSA